MNRVNVLRVLGIGFALVILLLAAVAYIGIDKSQEIRANARALVRDHLMKDESGRAARLEALIERQSTDLVLESGPLLAACFLLALACAALTMKVTNDSFRDLETRTAELTQVSWHMLQGQEAAARRFSHEMHDELGQSLTGLKTTLNMITPQEFAERREEYAKMLEQAIRDVRELSQLLRPVILDDFGLDAALRWVAERFQERTRIQVEYVSNCNERLAEQLETHLFRITQESLTNVARHSGATEVRVELREDGELIRLTIEDNGRGLPPEMTRRRPSLGMIGMRARAAQAGGDLQLSKSPGGGVRIEVALPLRRPVDDSDQEDPDFVGR